MRLRLYFFSILYVFNLYKALLQCVLVPPTIETADRVLTVNMSDEVTLPCVASGFPEPKISWLYDGRTLLKSGGRFEIEDTGPLIISDVQVNLDFTYVYAWRTVDWSIPEKCRKCLNIHSAKKAKRFSTPR